MWFAAACSVRAEGLEPPCLAAPDPKSGMSANFTTPASKSSFFKKRCKSIIFKKKIQDDSAIYL